MKLLIAYNFSSEELHISAPNFYKSCAEKVFPQFSVNTTFIPNLRDHFLFRLLVLIGVKQTLALSICVGCWLSWNGHKFDVIVGWVTNGIIVAVLKRILHWHDTRVCLILYHMSGQNSMGFANQVKRNILRFASNGADIVLALDSLQAVSFAQILRRRTDATHALTYGVDTDWYDIRLRSVRQKVLPATIFCPGSAFRDDRTLENAVRDLDVHVMRYQLDNSVQISTTKAKLGRAFMERNYNAPYSRYIDDCCNAAIVVIAVANADKPVGLTSLLECMALGRPIIITDGASSRDYVRDGENGLIYEEGNWEELREKIRFLLENPHAAQRIGAKAREKVRQEFGLYTCGQRLHNYLQNKSTIQ
jgi:hypothetical protein